MAAGPVVDQLAAEYSSRPVLFLEQDVDNVIGDREERWWAAYGTSGTVYLPLVMVDSGHQVTSGSEDFHAVYGAMVDVALQRPPGARLKVTRERVDGGIGFEVELTNQSGATLSSIAGATLYAMVYEDPGNGPSRRAVKAVNAIPIPELGNGETGTYTLHVPLGNPSWADLPALIFVEYQPSGSPGAWDMLQAVVVN